MDLPRRLYGPQQNMTVLLTGLLLRTALNRDRFESTARSWRYLGKTVDQVSVSWNRAKQASLTACQPES